MFPGAGALKRLQMCADCRVVDMMENKDEASIFRHEAMTATFTRWRSRPPEIPEEQARAGYYALLARLYYAGPDADCSPPSPAPTRSSRKASNPRWRAPGAPSRRRGGDGRGSGGGLEYDQLFVGTARRSHPLCDLLLGRDGPRKGSGAPPERTRRLGAGSQPSSREPEDTWPGLFDVMRHLISMSSDAAARSKKDFSSATSQVRTRGFALPASKSEKSNFYKHVARFARAFLHIESEALKVF